MSGAVTKERVAIAVWCVGIAIVSGFMIASWVSLPFPRPFRPVTPFDYTPTSSMESWLFLRTARDCIEPGATVITIAAKPEVEHELFVLSVALLDHNPTLAMTYFGDPHPENLPQARYVLAYRVENDSRTGGLREVCRVPFGIVYEKP